MTLGALLMVGSDLFRSDLLNQGLREFPSPVRSSEVARSQVLGRSILRRTIANLERAGVGAISIIAERRASAASLLSVGESADLVLVSGRAQAGDAIQGKIAAQFDNGIRNVLLLDLESYIEFDVADTIELCKERSTTTTRLRDAQGHLNAWIVDALRALQKGLPVAALLRQTRSRIPYRVHGYVNRLSSAQELHQLVVDSFRGRCALRPIGTEVKPHVWMDQGARIDRYARVVAPAYLGKNSQLRAGALITRGSSIEEGCIVDCGTVVENSLVLPHTYLGRGLDISQAVVDGSKLVHLKRNVALQVTDANLVSTMKPGPQQVFEVDPIYIFPDGNARTQGNFQPAQVA